MAPLQNPPKNPFFTLPHSTVDLTYIFIAFGAVAIWSTITLTIRLLTTLKKQSGLYFYSLLVTTWCLSIRQTGNFLQFLSKTCPWEVGFTFQQVGWAGMVSGFAMVLYSRLSIIMENRKARRAVLGLIIVNAVVWHTSMFTIMSGMRTLQFSGQAHRIHPWTYAHDRVEKIQVVMFSLQEILISCLYVRAAYQYLQSRFAQKGKTRNTMALLFFVQVLAIAFDVAIVFMDFAGYLQLKLITFSFVYAIKLELEFVALNQLVEISKMGVPGLSSISFRVPGPDLNEPFTQGPNLMNKPTGAPSKVGHEEDLELQSGGSTSSKQTLDFVTEMRL